MTSPAMRHLLVIDTASRMATQILNGRQIGPPFFLSSLDGPDEVEVHRTSLCSSRVFHWTAHEILVDQNPFHPPKKQT